MQWIIGSFASRMSFGTGCPAPPRWFTFQEGKARLLQNALVRQAHHPERLFAEGRLRSPRTLMHSAGLVCALALIVFAQSLLCLPSTLLRLAAGDARWKGPVRDGSIRKSRLWDRFKINPDSLWLATVNFSMHWFMRMLPRGGEGSMGARLRRLKRNAPPAGTHILGKACFRVK